MEDADGGITEGAIRVGGIEVHAARGKVGLVLQDPDAQAIFQRLGITWCSGRRISTCRVISHGNV